MQTKTSNSAAHRNLCLPRKQIEALFWPLVDKRGPGECWAWLGKIGPNGIGLLHVRNGKRGQTLTSRRLAVWFSGIPLPASRTFVRGLCPNRTCVNPNHLRLGNAFAVSNEPPYLAFDDLRFRFTQKKKSVDPSGCINWEASKSNGYGKLICADLDGKKRVLFAHKIAVYLTTRVWPQSNEAVCHSCDNPSCVNIKHLYVGDWATNGKDASNRGRHNRPETLALKKAAVERGCYETEACRKAFEAKRKLTSSQIRKIRKTYADNQKAFKNGKPSCGCKYTQATIQAKLGCGENTVSRAIHRSVNEAKPETKKRNDLIRKLYFGPHGHARCKALGVRSKRVTFKALAQKYGVNTSTIDYAIHGRRKPTMVAGRVAPQRNSGLVKRY